MKPLSEKTLEKRYIKAGIEQDDRKRLCNYFECFANLYGAISLHELWPIIKKFEKNVSEEKVYNFACVNQRDNNKSYEIYDFSDLFIPDNGVQEKDKFIINKKLLGYGQGKFWLADILLDNRNPNVNYYVPTKEELFKFIDDQFYITDIGKKVVNFVNNIRTSGLQKGDFLIVPKLLTNLDPEVDMFNKKFCEFRCHTSLENIDFKLESRPTYIEHLKEKNDCLTSIKVLNQIEYCIMCGKGSPYKDSFEFIIGIIEEYGGILDESNIEELLSIINDLNNSSNLWINRGWKPLDLTKKYINDGPIELSFGKNIKKMFESGEYDLNELKKFCEEKGIELVVDDNEEEKTSDNSKTIYNNNEYYLIGFEEYLLKQKKSSDKIKEHVNRIGYYAQSELMNGVAKDLSKGCSLDFFDFIRNHVNQKYYPCNVNNIDDYINSFLLFYRYMVEIGVCNDNEYKEVSNNLMKNKDELVDDYYDKNQDDIVFKEIVNHVEESMDFEDVFLHRISGRYITVYNDRFEFSDDIENEINIEKIEDDSNYIRLPNQTDFNEYLIMQQFAYSLTNENNTKTLINALNQRHPYRQFKNAINNLGIYEKYYSFKREEIEKYVKEWVEKNNIANVRY